MILFQGSADPIVALGQTVDFQKVIAAKFVEDSPAKGVAMQRPLCPYPQAAQYKGAGDVNPCANFACAKEK